MWVAVATGAAAPAELKGRFEELATEDVGVVFMCCFYVLFFVFVYMYIIYSYRTPSGPAPPPMGGVHNIDIIESPARQGPHPPGRRAREIHQKAIQGAF